MSRRGGRRGCAISISIPRSTVTRSQRYRGGSPRIESSICGRTRARCWAKNPGSCSPAQPTIGGPRAGWHSWAGCARTGTRAGSFHSRPADVARVFHRAKKQEARFQSCCFRCIPSPRTTCRRRWRDPAPIELPRCDSVHRLKPCTVLLPTVTVLSRKRALCPVRRKDDAPDGGQRGGLPRPGPGAVDTSMGATTSSRSGVARQPHRQSPPKYAFCSSAAPPKVIMPMASFSTS